MRVTYSLVLAFLLIIIFILNYRKEKDLFSPLCFVTMMIFIRYVPNMMEKQFENFSQLNDSNIFKLFSVEMVSIMAILIGYYIGKKVSIKKYESCVDIAIAPNEYSADRNIRQWVIITLFAVGMVARLRVILMSGGINYITQNAAVAYISLSNGTGFLSMFSNFAIVAVMMELSIALQAYHDNNIALFKRKRVILIIMIAMYSFTFLIFTSRSPIFELLLFVLFGINYLWRKLKIKDFLNPKILLVIFISLVLIVMLPMMRQGQTVTIDKTTNIFSSVFDEFSYVGRDTFVYDHFNESNYWHGGNYKGLLTSFIPYSIYPQKPPNDDGIYLANIMYGHWVNPPVPRDDLIITYSIPFSTPGILYANFGMLGVFLGELLLGIIYAKVYRRLKIHNNVLWIIIFQLIVYQLELSTLSIIQTLIPLVIAYFAYKPATTLKIKLGKQ